jgi:DNA-binding GntR family transcriptional regulator
MQVQLRPPWRSYSTGEALQHLGAEGMIINEDEAREIYDVRRAMEYLVTESFIRKCDRGADRQIERKTQPCRLARQARG